MDKKENNIIKRLVQLVVNKAKGTREVILVENNVIYPARFHQKKAKDEK